MKASVGLVSILIARFGAEIAFFASDRSGLSVTRTIEKFPEYSIFVILFQIMLLGLCYLVLSLAAIVIWNIRDRRSAILAGNWSTISLIIGLLLGSFIEFAMHLATGR